MSNRGSPEPDWTSAMEVEAVPLADCSELEGSTPPFPIEESGGELLSPRQSCSNQDLLQPRSESSWWDVLEQILKVGGKRAALLLAYGFVIKLLLVGSPVALLGTIVASVYLLISICVDSLRLAK